jgi:dethiobiotin synthetase
MMGGFFITGTDTGVGKTVITAALIQAIRILGLKVCGMKPIETGCLISECEVRGSGFGVHSPEAEALRLKDRVLIPSDGMFLKKMADMDDSIDLVTPIRLANPLAPLPASEIEDIPVDIEKIRKAYAELSEKYGVVVAEGIGGLLVPLKRDYFVLDLARDFGLPIIVVSRPGLGTINHTMLTASYAIKEGIAVAGIIINYSQPPEGTPAEKTNPEVIKRISPVPIIGIFPYLKDIEKTTIEKAAVKNLDIEKIKKCLF